VNRQPRPPIPSPSCCSYLAGSTLARSGGCLRPLVGSRGRPGASGLRGGLVWPNVSVGPHLSPTFRSPVLGDRGFWEPRYRTHGSAGPGVRINVLDLSSFGLVAVRCSLAESPGLPAIGYHTAHRRGGDGWSPHTPYRNHPRRSRGLVGLRSLYRKGHSGAAARSRELSVLSSPA
jgi:hypothetical protein